MNPLTSFDGEIEENRGPFFFINCNIVRNLKTSRSFQSQLQFSILIGVAVCQYQAIGCY